MFLSIQNKRIEMKLLLTITISLFLSLQVTTVQAYTMMPTNSQHTEKNIQWDIISAASGASGLVLAFVPYLSILGIGLCVVALVLGIIAKRKKQRKRWYRIGIICGSLGIVALLGVLGLMTFF